MSMTPASHGRRLRLADGTAGYISSRYVRSPIDYRAYFSKEGGRWQMMMLLAGD